MSEKSFVSVYHFYSVSVTIAKKHVSIATNRRSTGGGTVENGVFYGGPCQEVINREDLSPEAEE
jgi:hypothetical protein